MTQEEANIFLCDKLLWQAKERSPFHIDDELKKITNNIKIVEGLQGEEAKENHRYVEVIEEAKKNVANFMSNAGYIENAKWMGYYVLTDKGRVAKKKGGHLKAQQYLDKLEELPFQNITWLRITGIATAATALITGAILLYYVYTCNHPNSNRQNIIDTANNKAATKVRLDTIK